MAPNVHIFKAMLSLAVPTVQDTVMVVVARDGLAVVSAYTIIGLAVVLALLLAVLVLILVELRKLAQSWTGFISATGDRSQRVLEHANSAAQNLDYITQVARKEVNRLDGALEGLATGVGELSEQVRGRLADLAALADLAQSEAEEAVLDAAAKVRMLRSGAGLVNWARGLGGGSGTPEDDVPSELEGEEDASDGAEEDAAQTDDESQPLL